MNADTGIKSVGGRSGDGALLSILAADFVGALAGAMVYLTMIWWVLSQDVPDNIVGLMVLAIFIPLNLGVLLSGVAVMRYGARTLLVYSKLVAILGASACGLLLATHMMTLPILALVAVITYGAMSPSITADIARVPALTRLAKRKLVSFHALNSVVMVLGQVGGMILAGLLADHVSPATIVGMAVVLLVFSTWITWTGFPRDRLRPMEPLTTPQHVRNMTNKVIARLDGSLLARRIVLATIGVIAVGEGVVEVILPLGYRAAEQSATALSGAYALAIAAGVVGVYWAQAKFDDIKLAPSIAALAIGLLALITVGWLMGGVLGITIAVAAASGAAAAGGTLTVTTLQNTMPVSLQAQAIGLWQAVSLAVGAVTILITGQIGTWGMPFLIILAAGAACLCLFGRRDS